MSFAINNFGHIPINPDILPEGEPTGQGSERPIGFTFDEIFKMYWNTKSFQVNFQVVNTSDAFLAFITSGGETSTLAGVSAGLGAAADAFKNGSALLSGKTKIIQRFFNKYRLGKRGTSQTEEEIFTFQNLGGDRTLREFKLDPKKTTQQMAAIISDVNEGILCSPGPIHSLSNDGGQVIIDLSSIIYRQRKYWPRIILSLIKGNAISFGNLGSTTLGGVSFNGALIEMSTGIITNTGIPLIVSGNITYGQDCCDKFYYDGKDKERNQECNCK